MSRYIETTNFAVKAELLGKSGFLGYPNQGMPELELIALKPDQLWCADLGWTPGACQASLSLPFPAQQRRENKVEQNL